MPRSDLIKRGRQLRSRTQAAHPPRKTGRTITVKVQPDIPAAPAVLLVDDEYLYLICVNCPYCGARDHWHLPRYVVQESRCGNGPYRLTSYFQGMAPGEDGLIEQGAS